MTRNMRPRVTAQRGRAGIILLSAIAALAMLGASWQFFRLIEADRNLNDIIREDAVWAVFQADRHLREVDHLLELIVDAERRDLHTDLVRQYDILYSRIILIERGTFVLDLQSKAGLVDRAKSLTSFVIDLAPRIDALDPESEDYIEQVRPIATDLHPYLAEINRLLLDSNVAVNQYRVDGRALRNEIQNQLAQIAIILVIAFIGIFVLLMIQMRNLAGAGQKMAVLQERSRRRAIRAQAASQAKSAFLATMSHEMRTPLNGIIGNAELIALNSEDDKVDPRLESIIASGLLLRDLIDGVLDFSRLDKGQVQVTPAPVSLSNFRKFLKLTFSEAAAMRGLQLNVEMPDEAVLLDETLFRQVLAKLLDNAFKFSNRGEVKVQIDLPDPKLLRCSIADQGIGISEENLPRLFRELSQLDNSHSRSFGGAGLGLAISKRIVTAMGGKIGVRSVHGQGSLFWFEIPVEPALLDEIENSTETVIEPKYNQDAHFLIVEDNPINADVLASHIQDLGHRSSIAINGQEALNFLQKNTVDLVLMDVQMPVMDGLSATRALRANGYTVPIVGVTANALSHDRVACLAAGMTDFLPKPVTRKSLVQMLRNLGFAAMHGKSSPEKKKESVENASEISAQFLDLVKMLGAESALAFVDRFEAEINAFEADMTHAIAEVQNSRQDNLLHTFKGAALTLGLICSGTMAQDLRQVLPVSSDQLADLIKAARADVKNTRLAMKELHTNA
jgi:signal transduction histidine kinase/DNA-binding NarL/FixJ family response regulator